MRFMVLVPATKESEAGLKPPAEILSMMGKFNEELVKAGVLQAAEGLHASARGARITYARPGSSHVTDGPFTETKEMIAGFWLIKVKSREEAIAIMQRAPFGGGFTLELREVFEFEDFGPILTPELREQQRRIAEGLARNSGR